MPGRDERHRARIEAQRRRRRRQGRRRPRLTRKAAVAGFAAVAVAVAGVTGSVLLRSDGREELRRPTRIGSTVVAGAAPVEIARAPTSYRVVYRSESGTGDDVVVTTDKAWVRRPWESRLESWAGPPPGSRRLSDEVAAFGVRRSGGPTEAPLVLAVTPQVAAADVRLAPALAAGSAAGLIERREVRRVAGRACQVYASGAFFSDPLLRKPTAAEHAESCVDEAGIVLEEVLFSGRRQILRRVAVEVEEEPALDPELFVTGEPTVGVKDGGGFLRQADPATRPEGEYFESPAPPAGFTFRGRYTIVPPQPENFSDPTKDAGRLAGTVDVFESGLDFLLVEQGATLRGAPAFVPDPASPTADLGALLGPGEVLLGPRGNEVRVARSGGRYLRVFGTRPPAELATVAAALRPVQGTGLVYLP